MKTGILTLFDKIKARFVSEDGAVAVDWIVLTAAIVGVAALAASTITDAVTSLGSSIGTAVSGQSVSGGN